MTSENAVCACTHKDPISDEDITAECRKDVDVATATGPYRVDVTSDRSDVKRHVPGGIGAVSHTNSEKIKECGTCARNASYHGDYVAVEYVTVPSTESIRYVGVSDT